MSDKPYSRDNPYAKDLTSDWDGFCALWSYVGAHQETYGAPPHYRKTAHFLASGGFMSAAGRQK